MPKKSEVPVTLLPGDGIGPEIVEATLSVLEALDAPFSWEEQLAGMAAEEETGDPLPAATMDSIRQTKLAASGMSSAKPTPKKR